MFKIASKVSTKIRVIQNHGRLYASSQSGSSATVYKELSEMPGVSAFQSYFDIFFDKDLRKNDRNRYFLKNFERFGDVYKLHIPFASFLCVVVRNPDDVETYFKTTMDQPIRNAMHSLGKVRREHPENYFKNGTGLLPTDHDEWWNMRKKVQGALLRPQNVVKYLPKTDEVTRKFMDIVDGLRDEDGKLPEDFNKEIYKWGLEAVGLVALDRELGCLEPNLSPDSDPMRMISLSNAMLLELGECEVHSHLWRLYKTPGYLRLEKAHNEFVKIADKYIEESMEKLKQKDSPGEKRNTILETYLETGLTKGQVAVMVLDMLGAGIDTTSHTLTYAMYILAKHPEQQRKMQQEIDEVMGDSDELKKEHIAKLNYMSNVVKETFRLYPLALGNARTTINDDVVISGYKVPKGTVVLSIATAIVKNEKYFPRPEEFLPERWEKARPLGKIHPFASLPFSTGKRMCVGKRIAEQEIYCFLTRMFQRFDLSYDGELVTDPNHIVRRPASPLKFILTPRRKPPV